MARRRVGHGFTAKALLLAALMTSHASPAYAEEDPKTLARSHFSRGVALASAGTFADALSEFRRAYELSPHYSVLYNIGQAHIALSQPVEAVEALRRYLAEGGANIPPARQAEVEAQLRDEATRIGHLDIRVDTPGAEITVDDVAAGRAPLAAPLPLAAGRHRVRARSNLAARDLSVEVIPQSTLRIDLALAVVANPAPEPTPEPKPAAREPLGATPPPSTVAPARAGSSRTLAYVFGVAGLGLGAAAVTHFLWNGGRYRDWQNAYADYRANRMPDPAQRGNVNELATSVERANVVTIGLAVASGAALVAGTLLLVADRPAKETKGSSYSSTVVDWRSEW